MQAAEDGTTPSTSSGRKAKKYSKRKIRVKKRIKVTEIKFVLKLLR